MQIYSIDFIEERSAQIYSIELNKGRKSIALFDSSKEIRFIYNVHKKNIPLTR